MPRYIDANKIEYSDFKGDARRFTIESIAYRRQIDSIPTADVGPVRHGRWLDSGSICTPMAYKPRSKNEKGFHTALCSACNMTQSINVYEGKPQFLFCPYCGAEMSEEVKYR